MSSVALPAAEAESPTTACFAVHARAEPGVMPRVLELFAKRGLVPAAWRSSTCGPDHQQLTIDIQTRGIGRETMDYIAACMRQIAYVNTVLTTEDRGGAGF